MELINNNFGLGQTNCNRFPENLFKVRITEPNNLNRRLKMKQLVEQFKPIKDFEGIYSISNLGYVISEANEKSKKERILKFGISTSGYAYVILYKKGENKISMIHHLVWDHFGNKPRTGRILQVDHKDENKLNNRRDNLQLLTSRQNCSKYRKTQMHSSKYTGVSWSNKGKRWNSLIEINGKGVHLGSFTKEYNAYLSYQRALIEFNKTGKVTINTPAMKQKTSKYKGVSWSKKNKKWQSAIYINKKQIYLGYFTNEYEAHLAYQKALEKRIICHNQ